MTGGILSSLTQWFRQKSMFSSLCGSLEQLIMACFWKPFQMLSRPLDKRSLSPFCMSYYTISPFSPARRLYIRRTWIWIRQKRLNLLRQISAWIRLPQSRMSNSWDSDSGYWVTRAVGVMYAVQWLLVPLVSLRIQCSSVTIISPFSFLWWSFRILCLLLRSFNASSPY